MHRYIMGFAMAGPAFLNDLMLPFVTEHALQCAVVTLINLLTAVLLFMTAAAERRGDASCQFGRCRSVVLMTFEAVFILHSIGMTIMALQAAETFSVARMALIALQLCMSSGKTLHLFTHFRMTAETDGTQVFY